MNDSTERTSGLSTSASTLFGLAQRWRRTPYVSLNDEKMEQLAAFFRGLGLL